MQVLGHLFVAERPPQRVGEVVQRDEAFRGHAVGPRLLSQCETLAFRAVPAAAVAGFEMRQLLGEAGAALRLVESSV